MLILEVKNDPVSRYQGRRDFKDTEKKKDSNCSSVIPSSDDICLGTDEAPGVDPAFLMSGSLVNQFLGGMRRYASGNIFNF